MNEMTWVYIVSGIAAIVSGVVTLAWGGTSAESYIAVLIVYFGTSTQGMIVFWDECEQQRKGETITDDQHD